MAKNIVVTDEYGTAAAAPELANLKVAQLRVLAQQLGIRGYLKLKKAELVQALEEHQRGGAVAALLRPSLKSLSLKHPTPKLLNLPRLPLLRRLKSLSLSVPAVLAPRRTPRLRLRRPKMLRLLKPPLRALRRLKNLRSVPAPPVTRLPLRSVRALAVPLRVRTHRLR